jgi:hypothetical protein
MIYLEINVAHYRPLIEVKHFKYTMENTAHR